MDTHHAGAIVTLFDRLLTLKLLPRTGWLQRGVAQAESVAEHTYGVAALALLVSDHVPDIDRGRLLAIALLHDVGEVLMGDLPRGAKRYFGAAAKLAAERLATEEMLADLPPPQRDAYLTLWDDYATGESREARLVKQLDRLEMLMQAHAYARAGNRAMAEFWLDAHEGWSEEFPFVQELANQLLVQHYYELRPAEVQNGAEDAHN